MFSGLKHSQLRFVTAGRPMSMFSLEFKTTIAKKTTIIYRICMSNYKFRITLKIVVLCGSVRVNVERNKDVFFSDYLFSSPSLSMKLLVFFSKVSRDNEIN